MIVLEVLPALESGGAQLSVLETVSAIATTGGTALVASAGGRMVPAVKEAGARHFSLPMDAKNPLLIWRNADRLARLVRRENVDLVHAHSRAPAWSALLAARRTGIPFVTTWHGTYEETFPLKRRYNAVMASGERVIAVSRFIAARITARHGISAPRLVIVPPGIDPARFDPAAVPPARSQALARQWQLPEGHPVIMLPGRLAGWKGHGVLLAALARMQTKTALCVFVGPLEGRAQYVAELMRSASRFGIAGRVHFVGACNDMPAALALADIVVNASTAPEAFGRVVIEAQAMQRLVIATDHGAASETVLEGTTGWRVPPAEPTALAAALERILAMPDAERTAIGREARASVIHAYSLASMQAATLAVYRDLLADRATPAVR